MNSSLTFYYTFDVSRGNSDLNSSLIFYYTFDDSRGNSDLNSSLIFNYAFDVSLRVDFTNTFLYKACEIKSLLFNFTIIVLKIQ